jgi:hypothetical protein
MPTYFGNDTPRVGVPSHRRRTIELDVIVRTKVNAPHIEIYEDTSLRYFAQSAGVLSAIRQCGALSGYVSRYGSWVELHPPICVHCLRPSTQHVREKCLFESTSWQELLVPPDSQL